MEYEISVIKTHKFSDQDLDDLMVTALEGGINYWCYKPTVKEGSMSEENYDKTEFIGDIISKGGTLLLFDVSSDDIWELNRDKLLKGIQMYCEIYNVAPSDLMEMHDADDVDTIIQYSIFNELVFS